MPVLFPFRLIHSGLTNTHPGNRRFRDIILLHRPDYVRAIKIEKPNVARRIVRAIRYGPSPGRFLRKDAKNGMWYDVGDRHAAEKTSQALREKTQAEKAARFDEDKRKRLREGGLSQLASQRGARMYPVLPLPALSPADLQRMVQTPFGVNLAGAPMMGAYGVPGMPAAMPPNGDKATASPNCAKPAAAASVTAASVAAAAGADDDQKIAAQDRFDSEGNILVTDSDVIAGRGGRRYAYLPLSCSFVVLNIVAHAFASLHPMTTATITRETSAFGILLLCTDLTMCAPRRFTSQPLPE